jgi:hypothetical protein
MHHLATAGIAEQIQQAYADECGTHPGRVMEWPARPRSIDTPVRVAVITVNYNARLLIAQLIYSPYARLGKQAPAQLLVVASLAGTVEEMAAERLP